MKITRQRYDHAKYEAVPLPPSVKRSKNRKKKRTPSIPNPVAQSEAKPIKSIYVLVCRHLLSMYGSFAVLRIPTQELVVGNTSQYRNQRLQFSFSL